MSPKPIVMHPKQTAVSFNDIQATDIPRKLLCQKKCQNHLTITAVQEGRVATQISF